MSTNASRLRSGMGFQNAFIKNELCSVEAFRNHRPEFSLSKNSDDRFSGREMFWLFTSRRVTMNPGRHSQSCSGGFQRRVCRPAGENSSLPPQPPAPRTCTCKEPASAGCPIGIGWNTMQRSRNRSNWSASWIYPLHDPQTQVVFFKRTNSQQFSATLADSNRQI